MGNFEGFRDFEGFRVLGFIGFGGFGGLGFGDLGSALWGWGYGVLRGESLGFGKSITGLKLNSYTDFKFLRVLMIAQYPSIQEAASGEGFKV